MWNKRTGNFTIFSFIDNRKEVYLSYVQINVSILSMFLVGELGNIKMNTWLEGKGKWVESYSALDERCDSYGRCGGFGYCNENKGQAEFECMCLPGYEPKSPNEWYYSRDASGGCVKKRATLGMCGNGEGFVKMERAKIPPTSKGDEEMNLSMEECEAKCLRNCSCTAYTIASDGGNYCKTWYGTLMNARTAHSARYSLYIRVDADELLAQHLKKKSKSLHRKKMIIVVISVVKKKSKSLHRKKMIIVVTSVVVMAALIISLVCWLVMKKARRGKQIAFH
ncbi:G-type lectin S-receptor-like serine/threonine-protein kinase [Camellia lanceoleosa]|uniref:G-type lectin S-receptor-like serine/threonine-protein kinase n=1 Tax=Camellia lanceoleosa TaxID=1840588 RepID=A0ACC0FNI2_9ERIC|nr:G-type lectin S-receptor-like serine/threonine-protein kinase [Camellia lanceoleosa]